MLYTVLTECVYAHTHPDYSDHPFCRGGAPFTLGHAIKKQRDCESSTFERYISVSADLRSNHVPLKQNTNLPFKLLHYNGWG